MFETDDDLHRVQALLDESFTRASSHLTSIMTPQRRMSAPQLAAEIPTPAVLNIATVTARGEPRISAVDGHFLHGRWYFTTAADSPKVRQLTARPAISASYTPRDGFGVFCHGSVTFLDGDERDMVQQRFVEVYGMAPEELAPSISYCRIDARWMVAFAMSEEEMGRG